MSPRDKVSAAQIRYAITRRQYRQARRLWEGYAAQLRAAIEDRTITAAQMEEAGELARWGRLVALCARAHLQQRYRAIEVASVYARRTVRTGGVRAVF